MLLMLLCIQAVVQVPVVSEATLAPPQNIHVDKWLLTWTPATEERDVIYTVQYHRLGTKVWKDVPVCKQTSFNSCNVTLIRDESEFGCVMLRVRAERHGLTSKSVNACSRNGDSCSPEVSLTARPGSLTVNLSRNNSIALENGDNVEHKVYYGKDGEPLQKYKKGISSVTIKKLEEGQRYCVKVQYVQLDEPVGPESCIQCEVIPVSRQQLTQTNVIVAVVVVVFVSFLITGMAYVLLFRHQRIKQWLQPPCEIPEHFLLEAPPGHHPCSYASSVSDEHCDIISFIE
ncbi:interferon gamma receptor 2 isoform X1 [Paralichthys olivaceus]|uniref:interferon gamma receptor 2 isoform X1 n=1 Tax=Paralichthys olivaceus TaxID=8255 RepID=UPI00097D074D|nr:PREDICTED: interferon alpha/beta receptor 1-like isoform X2 [Paralichthys olivaceus]